MATWAQLSQESIRTARVAFSHGFYRSSVSRSYYSAYAAITQALVDRKMLFADDRQGPGHQQLREMVERNVGRLRGAKRLRAGEKRLIKANLNLLYEHRLDADYRPNRSVEEHAARNSLIAATLVVGTFGVKA